MLIPTRNQIARSGLIAVLDRNLLLDLDCAADRAIYTIEYDEQGVATSLNDPAAVLLDRRIDHVGAESTQSVEGSASSRPIRRL